MKCEGICECKIYEESPTYQGPDFDGMNVVIVVGGSMLVILLLAILIRFLDKPLR